MDNKVLDRIKAFAIKELQANYGYCGSAQNPDQVWINSDDGKGRDIKIIIELKPKED